MGFLAVLSWVLLSLVAGRWGGGDVQAVVEEVRRRKSHLDLERGFMMRMVDML